MNTIYLPDNTEVFVADTNLVSDGYHTFGELYEHRCKLFALLINTFDPVFGYSCFKTRQNDKGETWDGWFIAGLNTPAGQISYHLPDELWDVVDAKIIEYNDTYDKHTSDDVLMRLVELMRLANPV